MNLGFSRSYIKKIGDKLRHGQKLEAQEEMDLTSFRFEHKHIMEFFLNKHIELLSTPIWREKKVVLAARLKKRETIISKLSSRLTEMNLSRMHDIAGCRLIFDSVSNLYEYRKSFAEKVSHEKLFPYKRNHPDEKYDYIKTPRHTGYRSIHDVYIETDVSDGIEAFIEIQYRTRVQHYWATALEIWDNAHGKGAKFGTESSDISFFFQNVGELFWRFLDSQPDDKRIPLSNRQLYNEIATLDRKNHVIEFFKSVKRSVGVNLLSLGEDTNMALIRRRRDDVELLNDTENESIRFYSWEELKEQMLQDEANQDNDTVWVYVNGKSFAKAYNNYYNDARNFRKYLAKSLKQAYESIDSYKRLFVPNYNRLVKGLTYEDKTLLPHTAECKILQ